MLSKAIEIAANALKDIQDDKGFPYIDHAMRVMDKMDTEEEKIAAILHDVLEDTEMSIQDLKQEGFSREVLETVAMLTKRKDMTYFDYIDDILCSDLAAKIKIAEIEDNKDIKRVQKMSFQTYTLDQRAAKALLILRGENTANDYK